MPVQGIRPAVRGLSLRHHERLQRGAAAGDCRDAVVADVVAISISIAIVVGISIGTRSHERAEAAGVVAVAGEVAGAVGADEGDGAGVGCEEGVLEGEREARDEGVGGADQGVHAVRAVRFGAAGDEEVVVAVEDVRGVGLDRLACEE